MAGGAYLERNLLFAIGGYNGREALKTLEVLDLGSSKWEAGPPMTTGRRGAAVVMYDKQIFIFGGWGDAGIGEGCLNTTEIFDIANWEWRSGIPMPSRRCNFAASFLDGSIFAAGGRGDGHVLALVEEFDISSKRWESAPPLQKARSGLAMASQGGRLFAVGGDVGSQHVEEVGIVEILDPQTGAWQYGPALSMRRCDPAIAVHGEKIFVVGGFGSRHGGGGSFLDSIEVFDPVSWAWVPAPRDAQLCHSRSGMGTALVPSAGKMLVLGGPFAGCGRTTVEVFDVNTMERTLAPVLPSQRWGVCVAAHDGDALRDKRTDLDRRTAARCGMMEAIAMRDVEGLRIALSAGQEAGLEPEELVVGTRMLKNFHETGWLVGAYNEDGSASISDKELFQFSALSSATSNAQLSETSFVTSLVPQSS